MTKRGSSSKGPSRRSTKLTPFEQEFPGSSESANASIIALVRTTDALLSASNLMMAPFELSQAGREALAILEGAGDPLSPTEISRRMFVTTASTTSLLDTLERRGYVTRLPDPDDRRKVLVQLTEAGRALVNEFLPKLIALQTAAVSELNEAEREGLIRSLHTIQETVTRLDVAKVAQAAQPRGKRRRD